MNYINVNGDKKLLVDEFSKLGFIENEAEEIVKFLQKNQNFLCDCENIKIETRFPQMPPEFMCLMIPHTNYYINLKTTTIAIAALLLDIKITKGAASTLLSLCGLTNKAIHEINDYNGERCIVKETIMTPSKTGNVKILSQFHGECCNNDMRCVFRHIDKCLCSEDDILNIYDKLTSYGLFKKEGDSYKYQL